MPPGTSCAMPLSTKVLRLSRLVELQHRVLDALGPELRGLAVLRHAGDHALDRQRLAALLAVEEHEPQLAPRVALGDAHRVIRVVVDDELRAARVARELALVVDVARERVVVVALAGESSYMVFWLTTRLSARARTPRCRR